MSISITTFGDMIDKGFTLWVYCDTWGCHHGKQADLHALAARYGRDYGSTHDDLVKLPWRCEKCGGRKVTFRLQPGSKQYLRRNPDDGDVPF